MIKYVNTILKLSLGQYGKNQSNTDNFRIGLVFAVLAQWKFLYCIDRFDHIKANKSKLINKIQYTYFYFQLRSPFGQNN